MKTTSQFLTALLVILLLSATAINAQPTDAESRDSLTRASSFEVGTYMGANWTINLMLVIHQPEEVTIILTDNKNTILYRKSLKTPKIYRQKFSFDGSASGEYKLEISNGRQTIVRRIEVVDIPAIESQRYITYSSPTSL